MAKLSLQEDVNIYLVTFFFVVEEILFLTEARVH